MTSSTYRTSPCCGALTRYGGSSRMPSAPACSTRAAWSRATGVGPPAAARTGTRPAVALTATRVARSISSDVSAWNSPVPQATNTPPAPASTPASMCWASRPSSSDPSAANGVTGKNSTPWNFMSPS
ncbi:hypothetical protein SALBM311S_04915 [Streptomyces alboniger]